MRRVSNELDDLKIGLALASGGARVPGIPLPWLVDYGRLVR